MSRQTSVQITEATDRQVASLKERGFGTFTDIVRIAIDRMYRKEVREVDKITVTIGAVQGIGTSGRQDDFTRPVEFVGEEIVSHTVHGISSKGYPTDTRGVTETLYRTEDGRLIVHINDWSHWAGEATTGSIVEIDEADLQVGGRFEMLGRDTEFGRALTLDEAIENR